MEIYEALREARNLSGKSQEYMALELGVARKTVQNWEWGASEPSIGQAIAWFKAIDVNPLPYLFKIIHADLEGNDSDDDIKRLHSSLTKLIKELPEEGTRQLLYLFYGKHGSSPRAVLNMLTAHLQTPMSDRVVHGNVILKNYERAKKKNRLTNIEHIQPNEALLRRAIAMGEEADLLDKNAYILVNDK